MYGSLPDNVLYSLLLYTIPRLDSGTKFKWLLIKADEVCPCLSLLILSISTLQVLPQNISPIINSIVPFPPPLTPVRNTKTLYLFPDVNR